jgi:hypothetical protein
VVVAVTVPLDGLAAWAWPAMKLEYNIATASGRYKDFLCFISPPS